MKIVNSQHVSNDVFNFYSIAHLGCMNINGEEALKAIGNRVRELRISAGHSSHEEFADIHGFQRKQIWRLESGQDFKISTLVRLADIHKITLEEFFKGL